MTHKIQTLRAWPLLIATVVVMILALSIGCTQEPTAPDYANPLDPDGPYQGDPFQVLAGYVNGAVVVSWTGLSLPDITAYEVLHSLMPDGPFNVAGSVDFPITSYSHSGYSPNQANYYKVRAIDGLGGSSAISHVQVAAIQAPPHLEIGEGNTTVSRTVDLLIRVDMGDSVEVDSQADFSTAAFYDFDENGEVTIPWDLGSAAENGEWKYVFLKVYTADMAGEAYEDSVEIVFEPQLHIEGDPVLIGTMTPTLEIMGDGVVDMRFADSREALDPLAWLPGDTLYNDYSLDALPDSQLVFAEFSCDFGFTFVDSLWAVPDSLNTITLLINNGAESTGDLDVQLNTDMAATQMRFAETVGELAAASWLDYATPSIFTHSGCTDGLVKTVHGQFRNDWFNPEPVSDDIQWLPPEVLDITLAAPDTVGSEENVAVSGTAIAGTCTAPLDGVEFNDGGDWVVATGLENWTLDWTAPQVVEHTTITLMARVTAGVAADTVEVEIVVTP